MTVVCVRCLSLSSPHSVCWAVPILLSYMCYQYCTRSSSRLNKRWHTPGWSFISAQCTYVFASTLHYDWLVELNGNLSQSLLKQGPAATIIMWTPFCSKYWAIRKYFKLTQLLIFTRDGIMLFLYYVSPNFMGVRIIFRGFREVVRPWEWGYYGIKSKR